MTKADCAKPCNWIGKETGSGNQRRIVLTEEKKKIGTGSAR